MLKMQLLTEQRVFVVKTFYNTSSYLEAEDFQRKTHQQIGQYGETQKMRKRKNNSKHQ